MAPTHWCKLWPDKLLASARWKRLTTYQQGVYINVFLRCASIGDGGHLRTAGKPWSLADLAQDMGCDRRRIKRLGDAVNHMVAEGLLEMIVSAELDDQGQPKEKTLRVARWDELQAPSQGSVLRALGDAARQRRV